ncbi:MAG TPA: hypothetical protein PKD55_00195 [Bellilinea sp.]|nr:hypothetical protein [Bellilinea sp.]
MAWIYPSPRSTGNVITASIWNQDVVYNSVMLHDRRGYMWVPVLLEEDGASSFAAPNSYTGDWAHAARGDQNNRSTFFSFAVPADYLSIHRAWLVCFSAQGQTPNLVVNTDYGNPDNNEPYNAHNGSMSFSYALPQNQLRGVDIAAALPAINGGDFVGIQIWPTLVNSSPRWVGMWFVWNRK